MLAFIAWTLCIGGIWLCLRPFLSEASRIKGGALALHRWSCVVCFILGVKRFVSGEPRREPVLFAANHIGYLDIAVLASEVPVVFVSKAEVANWPILGPLGRAIGTIFLERDRPRSMIEVATRMRDVFRYDQSVVVFPEGTTTEGRGISDLRPALFEPAFRAEVPIQGVFLEYVPRSPSETSQVGWYGEDTFLPHFYRLLCGGGWTARIRFQDKCGSYADRREAAQTLQTWMKSSLSF